MSKDIIGNSQKEELVKILERLVIVIEMMRRVQDKYILQQNAREANDWLSYLNLHNDKEELMSLKKEIAERLVHKYDVIVNDSELDDERVFLMKNFITKAGCYLK